jgi:hypothetical protein
MRSDADRLGDILAAIAKTKEQVADRLAFHQDGEYRAITVPALYLSYSSPDRS